MLILSRRSGESIVIGIGISITVMHVRGKAVSIGIDAPKEIGIRRGELCERSEESESPGLRATEVEVGLRKIIHRDLLHFLGDL